MHWGFRLAVAGWLVRSGWHGDGWHGPSWEGLTDLLHALLERADNPCRYGEVVDVVGGEHCQRVDHSLVGPCHSPQLRLVVMKELHGRVHRTLPALASPVAAASAPRLAPSASSRRIPPVQMLSSLCSSLNCGRRTVRKTDSQRLWRFHLFATLQQSRRRSPGCAQQARTRGRIRMLSPHAAAADGRETGERGRASTDRDHLCCRPRIV
jgi:hypothetical protein